MPRKIRELKRDLRQAGFEQQRGRGKGDHTVWRHPLLGRYNVNLPGKDKDGEDAKHYQETEVREGIRLVREAERKHRGT